MKTILIYLNGGSGIGKTTLGNELLKQLNILYGDESTILIDQDSFYKKDKPFVEYKYETNDSKITYVKEKNWDTLDSIDMEVFNQKIDDEIKRKNVIVTGFALRNMKLIPDHNILLNYNLTSEQAKEKMIEARSKSKKFSPEGALKDRKRIEYVIWPYYEQTLTLISHHEKLNIFDEKGNKYSLQFLLKQLLTICNLAF